MLFFTARFPQGEYVHIIEFLLLAGRDRIKLPRDYRFFSSTTLSALKRLVLLHVSLVSQNDLAKMLLLRYEQSIANLIQFLGHHTPLDEVMLPQICLLAEFFLMFIRVTPRQESLCPNHLDKGNEAEQAEYAA